VAAGWGGALALVGGEALTAGPIPNRSRLLVFSLTGDAVLPPVENEALVFDPPPLTANLDQIAQGKTLYLQYCVFCHGDAVVSGGATPDLRALSAEQFERWDAVVRGGAHWQNGMVGFGAELDQPQSQAIKDYVIERSHRAAAGTPGPR